jgi:hypothetical protein
MIYSVQVVEMSVVETAYGESGMPKYFLEERYSTIPQAEKAGAKEAARRKQEGLRVYYAILDQDGRPVGLAASMTKAPNRPQMAHDPQIHEICHTGG